MGGTSVLSQTFSLVDSKTNVSAPLNRFPRALVTGARHNDLKCFSDSSDSLAFACSVTGTL